MTTSTRLILPATLAVGVILGYLIARLKPAGHVQAAQLQPTKQAKPEDKTQSEKKPAVAAKKPNIVFMMADNLGYGEPGCYGGGILRGAVTPRIDKLAAQGTRLLNYSVESQCTPSRSALLTGRFALRSGTMRVNRGAGVYGLTQWEITLAEVLRTLGYATGIFGKWHLGNTDGRFPTDQGFDVWYGIPNSTSVSPWASSTGFDPKAAPVPHILESKRGEQPKKLEVYDLAQRRLIDTEITRRSIEFIKKNAAAAMPFYCYIPLTLVHYPTLAHPDFKGKTGNGEFADSLAELDHHVGEIVDAVSGAGIEDNTIVVFTSDNGPEEMLPWRRNRAR
jgi:arylsulfatase A-like enzyme